jgi:hypothetical protein
MEVRMLQTINMPGVSECAVAQCAYNSNKSCHAIAITIGDGDRPLCDTYFNSSRHGGKKEMAGVGACKVSACRHNADLECGAANILVGHEGNNVKCMTFASA